ncbi:MAG: hypothetical protein AAF547_05135 [Actinomycetota bacterium]
MSSNSIRTMDRRDLIWIVVGALMAGVFALVAYDQLFNLHFNAWRLYENTPSTEPLAEALRGPVTGWYRPLSLVVSVVAGLASTVRAIRGAWRPLASLVLVILGTIVGIEVTQSAGQLATPTSEVDSVAAISVVWTALIGIGPLLVLLVAAVGLAKDRVQAAPVAQALTAA